MKTIAITLLLISSLLSAEITCIKDIPYQTSPHHFQSRQLLDVYYNKDTANTKKPVILWIHGGAWKFGDKANGIELKAKAFVNAHYILVAINYRLHPEVNWIKQVQDIATATKWVTNNIGKYGGDPTRICLMGHSAGAHLAAMVAFDSSYLTEAKTNPSIIKSVVLLDGAAYDIPKLISKSSEIGQKIYTNIFSSEASTQVAASPINHIKTTPPTLLIPVEGRLISVDQSNNMAKKLKENGGTSSIFPAKDRTHMSLNKLFGSPNDPATAQTLTFLNKHMPSQ